MDGYGLTGVVLGDTLHYVSYTLLCMKQAQYVTIQVYVYKHMNMFSTFHGQSFRLSTQPALMHIIFLSTSKLFFLST